jgi:hypothetical protein
MTAATGCDGGSRVEDAMWRHRRGTISGGGRRSVLGGSNEQCRISPEAWCYMLIQILQSKGQLLTSGARPIAGGLGRVERTEIDLGQPSCQPKHGPRHVGV